MQQHCPFFIDLAGLGEDDLIEPDGDVHDVEVGGVARVYLAPEALVEYLATVENSRQLSSQDCRIGQRAKSLFRRQSQPNQCVQRYAGYRRFHAMRQFQQYLRLRRKILLKRKL